MHVKRLLETNFKEEEQINLRRRSQKRCLKQEAVTQRCSINKVISTLFKKRLWYRCFPVNFTKFVGTPFLTEHSRWLLLFQIKLEETKLSLKIQWKTSERQRLYQQTRI